MHEYNLSYQQLMSAVKAVTGPCKSIFPNDYNYVAIPTSAVREVLDSYKPGSWSPEINDSDAKARALWYLIKEISPRSACGLVRLAAPAAHDLVGVVTVEDISTPERLIPSYQISMSSEVLYSGILEDDLLDDEISEYQDLGYRMAASSPTFASRVTYSEKTATSPNLQEYSWSPSQETGKETELEMTLIEPYTKQIFKKSWGGTFGVASWPVKDIKAFAVWF